MENNESALQTCFVVMPISDPEGYDPGHFGRVYEYIIRPACHLAGLKPSRADEVQVTNYIVIDILKRILEAEMVICDLSSRNPNVLYELGVRQAFNLPVTLIKDSKTQKIFDIQGLRYIEYDESLRIDRIDSTVEVLGNTLKNTGRLGEGEVNSIVQLLGVKPANVPSVEVSKETSLLLDAISDLGKRMSRLEDTSVRSINQRPSVKAGTYERITTVPVVYRADGEVIEPGIRVRFPEYGEGTVTSITDDLISVKFDNEQWIGFHINRATLNDIEIISKR